ncbi:Lactose transport system permease protein LacF [subsurface metagenome]|nr:MAG: sugar ABC transporter permease [Candidatus Atribacteria bacterium 1244-E10-H5-B2]
MNKIKNNIFGYLYLSPVLVLIIVFLIYPFLNVIKVSFFSAKFGFGEMSYAGLKNYISLFQDEVFLKSIYNSVIWTIGNVLLQLSIPLGIALLLNRKFKGATLIKTLIIIPWIAPVVGIAMITKWTLEPQLGIANRILLSLGWIDKQINFLGSMNNAFPTLLFINSWQFIPFGTILILAALQTISTELYDAVKIDGANSWQTFCYLIFPIIGSMIGFVFFFGLVYSLNSFALIWITTKGGPVNATMTLPVLIYQKAFMSFNAGEASAIATLMGALLIIIGFLFFKYLWKGKNV